MENRYQSRRLFLKIAGGAGVAAFFPQIAEAFTPFILRMRSSTNHPPVWSSPAAGSLGSYTIGDLFSQTMLAIDPEGNNPVTYSKASGAYPSNLTLDGSSGLLTGYLSADNPPSWTSPSAGSMGTYNIGDAVSQSLAFTPVGAATIQKVLVISGFLPHGTAITYTAGNSTATLSGTIPNFYYPQLTYTTVSNTAPVWNTAAGSLSGTALFEGVAMSTITLSATPQGSATHRSYQVVSGYIPIGTTLNPTSGAITGSPLLLDQPNDPVVDVTPKPTWSSPAAGTLQTLNVGTAATSQTMSATANSPATSITNYSIVSGNLPPGLALTGAGSLTGTPANVLNDDTTFNFTVRAMDNLGGFADRAYAYIINVPDASWASVVLALRMEGTNASTTFTDEVGKTVTANGSAQISTATFKMGTSSGSFNGTNSYLSLSASTDFNLSANFTLDGWLKPTNFTQSSSANQTIFSSGTASTDWELHYNTSGTLILSTNNRATTILSATVTLTAASWCHFAFARSGTTVYAFINGAAAGTATSSTSFTSTALNIGCNLAATAGFYNGYMDDIRITKGVARYTAAFTSPIVQIPKHG